DLGEVATDFLRARGIAEAVQTAVRGTTQLTCSLGVASSKVVAKVASDSRKPGGITVVLPGREAAFLAPLAVRKLPGVGPRGAERLARAGVETVGALAEMDDRSEEHTSELQSPYDLVCRLLLEKKKAGNGRRRAKQPAI